MVLISCQILQGAHSMTGKIGKTHFHREKNFSNFPVETYNAALKAFPKNKCKKSALFSAECSEGYDKPDKFSKNMILPKTPRWLMKCCFDNFAGMFPLIGWNLFAQCMKIMKDKFWNFLFPRMIHRASREQVCHSGWKT